MRTRLLLPSAALGLGLALLASALAPAADKPDAARINKLVAQLGSDDFDDREKASAELAAVGEPALEVLRQAVKSSDEEVRRRAESLVSAIEKRVESATALAPRRVHLVYKDAPVKDAVEDFKKKSGYEITLHDPDNKLKDRMGTLDTGDATFWQAFGQFCEKAGLHEAEAKDLAPPPAPVPAVPVPPPPGAVLPGGPAIGVGPALPLGAPVAAGATPAAEGITLIDGKPEGLPTDASSAVRVQARPNSEAPRPASEGELQITLRLSLEPKLQWQGLDKVTVTKAVDDQKQELTQTSTEATPVGGPDVGPVPPGAIRIIRPLPLAGVQAGLGGERQEILVHLKKGDKAAKSMTELAGTITATVLGEIKPVITASDVLKAKDKVFKGGDNGQIKVVDVSKTDGGQITIRVEFQTPADVVPAGGGLPPGPVWRPRPIRRLPPVPAPAVPGAAAPAAVGAAIIIGRGGVVGAVHAADGLGLVDDKGAPIKQISIGTQLQVINGVASSQYVLTFQAEKGQEAAKLVFSGRKVLNVEIPFTLKDVPLP